MLVKTRAVSRYTCESVLTRSCPLSWPSRASRPWRAATPRATQKYSVWFWEMKKNSKTWEARTFERTRKRTSVLMAPRRRSTASSIRVKTADTPRGGAAPRAALDAPKPRTRAVTFTGRPATHAAPDKRTAAILDVTENNAKKESTSRLTLLFSCSSLAAFCCETRHGGREGAWCCVPRGDALWMGSVRPPFLLL